MLGPELLFMNGLSEAKGFVLSWAAGTSGGK